MFPEAATRGEARAMIIVIAPWSPEAERCRPQASDVVVSVVTSGRVLWRCSVRLRPVTDFEYELAATRSHPTGPKAHRATRPPTRWATPGRISPSRTRLAPGTTVSPRILMPRPITTLLDGSRWLSSTSCSDISDPRFVFGWFETSSHSKYPLTSRIRCTGPPVRSSEGFVRHPSSRPLRDLKTSPDG